MNTADSSNSQSGRPVDPGTRGHGDLGSRKQAHIDVCTDRRLAVEGGRGYFDRIRLVHRSLPELHYNDISSSTSFLGYQVSAPLLISCMTGGSDEGYRLNRILAEAAQIKGLPVGTGSLRILLNKPEVINHFMLKEQAPDVPVLGNIGAVQLPALFADKGALLKRFYDILRHIGIDALAVHLNPGQEIFQDDGDRDFSGLLEHIGRLCEISPLPIIVKETGAGIGPAEAEELFRRGVRYVDIAGSGGTNWLSVEALRLNPEEPWSEGLADFADWGIPSAVALHAARNRCRAAGVIPADGGLIASGGLRRAGDFAKAVAMGAVLGGAALPFIRTAREAGLEGVLAELDSLSDGIRKIMLLTGARDIPALSRAALVFEPDFLALSNSYRDADLAEAASPRVAEHSPAQPNSGTHTHDDAAISGLNDPRFRKYSIHERRKALARDKALGLDTRDLAASGHEDELLDLADVMVESAVGFMPVPLGIAKGFVIDGQTVHMPMAVEEPSVIAAASYAAGIIARSGGFVTGADEPLMSGYIYLDIPAERRGGDHIQAISQELGERHEEILALLDDVLGPMTRRGGGFRGIEADWLPETPALKIKLTLDVRNAMGANIINTACERISPLLEQISGGTKLMAILSNDSVDRKAWAEFSIGLESLHRGPYKGLELAERMVKLYRIADEDPSRAVTHNKGIMNGISSLALATANDTRATEAAAHAWAARGGAYRSLSRYWIEGDRLHGRLELPLALGTLGGGISFHPVARTALAILGQPDAPGLSRYAAALGLAQNFAAISALAGEGIQQGHMRLHSGRLAYSAGARGKEIPLLVAALQEKGIYNQDEASRLLEQIRIQEDRA